MDDLTLIGLITLPGLVLIFAGYDALARRIGGYRPLPGEGAGRFRNHVTSLAVAVALSFAIPVLGSWAQATAFLLGLALVAYLAATRERRAQRFAARPLAERQELERRVTFARTHAGSTLIAASLVTALVWSVGAVSVVRSLVQ